jgi:hypothetical protein
MVGALMAAWNKMGLRLRGTVKIGLGERDVMGISTAHRTLMGNRKSFLEFDVDKCFSDLCVLD